MALTEQLWREGRGGRSFRPVGRSLGVRCRGVSLGLQRVLTDFGAETGFARAVAQVREHYGVEVNASGVREATLRHGAQMARSQAEAAPLRRGGVRQVVAQMDGSMIPLVRFKAGAGDARQRRAVEWREARLCLARAAGRVERRYGACLGSVEEAGEQWRRAVVLAGGGRATQVHGVGDGAVWIGRQCALQFGSQGHYLVDFYHVSEYLSAAGRALGEGREWLRVQQERMKRNELEEVLGELRERAEVSEVKVCLGYLGERREQLDYAGALAAGLPIGSGEIESSHRHVLQARLKQSGGWWSESGARAMLGLRVERGNEGWEEYWAEQKRQVL